MAATYQVIESRRTHWNWRRNLVMGVLFGAVSVVGMMTPVPFSEGVILDGRSIILGIAGFVGGPLVAGIAASLAVCYRFYLGGNGAMVGVSVIIMSAAIGTAYHYRIRQLEKNPGPLRLWGFGLIITLMMLALFSFIPGGTGRRMIEAAGGPILLLYPVATMLVALLFQDYAEKAETMREQERLIKDLVRVNNEQQHFSFYVSHLLRAPVTNLRALAELMRDEPGTTPSMKDLVDGFAASTDRLSQTMDDLSEILVVRTRHHHKPVPVPVKPAVEQLLADTDELVRLHGGRIITEVPDGCAVAYDPTYFHFLLTELVRNSIRFRHPDRPPVIHLSARQEGDRINLVVEDNGSGLDTQLLGDRIYGFYQRFHPTEEGRGLGLYLIKTHLESLGATIRADGRPNVGLRLTISFAMPTSA